MTKAAWLSLAVALMGMLLPSVAEAHFTLDYPPAFTTQDGAGDPEKAYPCGVLATDTYTPTNMVTMFSPGQTITLKWTEIIPHDGWFRVALSYKDGADFQATTDFPEPPYATDALMNSLDAGIESPPVAPVLMDGIDRHTAASVSSPKHYTQDITLPMMPCQKCTLQVIQIMLNHGINPPNNVPGAGYTYHHCAFISIVAGGDGGTQIIPDSGGGGMPAGSGSASSGTASTGGATTGGSTGAAGGSSGTAGGASGVAGGSASGSANGGSSQGGESGGAGGTGGGGSSSGQGANGGTSSNGTSGGGSGGGCSASLGSVPRATGLAGLALVAALALARRKSAKPS